MKENLKEALIKKYDVPITPIRIKQIMKFCNMFELRKHNPEALNTSLLGVYSIYFMKVDYLMLFDIFDIDPSEFKDLVIKTERIAYIREQTKDPSNSVTSDPFNILIVWLCYCIAKSSVPSQLKEQGIFTLLKLLHYKFFSSYINHVFPHAPNFDLMQQTLSNLSNKYEIKNPKTSTWKLVIEARCKDVINKKSIHYGTLQSFTDDKAVLYILTDLQTRLRTRVQLVVNEFYKIKESKKHMFSTTLTSEIDNQKFLKDVISIFDTMIMNTSITVLNLNEFIDYDLITFTVKLVGNINNGLLRSLLTKFSDIAVVQYKAQRQEEIITKNGNNMIIGYKALVSNIIQKTYRLCVLDKNVDMKSKLSILKKSINLYRSSRISDRDILAIKDSIDNLILETIDVKRESTRASLKIAFIVYIMCLSFKYL